MAPGSSPHFRLLGEWRYIFPQVVLVSVLRGAGTGALLRSTALVTVAGLHQAAGGCQGRSNGVQLAGRLFWAQVGETLSVPYAFPQTSPMGSLWAMVALPFGTAWGSPCRCPPLRGGQSPGYLNCFFFFCSSQRGTLLIARNLPIRQEAERERWTCSRMQAWLTWHNRTHKLNVCPRILCKMTEVPQQNYEFRSRNGNIDSELKMWKLWKPLTKSVHCYLSQVPVP